MIVLVYGKACEVLAATSNEPHDIYRNVEANMDHGTAKAELLRRLVDEQNRFVSLLDGLTPQQYLEPCVIGGWSIRDLLAHLIAHEQRALLELAFAQRGETFAIDHAMGNAFNGGAAMACRPLDPIVLRAAWERSYQQVVDAVAALSDDEFLPSSPLGLALGDSIDGALGNNTYGHYAEHRVDVERWLELGGANTPERAA
jgi:uncharacterized protein (TIGR03083 family)